MWHDRYEDRLASWVELRQSNLENNLEEALMNINDWWQRAPVVNHYLHWDDHPRWPDPWDLLADNHFCSLAKALGIIYTIHMINRPDIESLSFGESPSSSDNLVLIDQGKYILNWAPGELLNITSQQISITKTLDARVVTKRIN